MTRNHVKERKIVGSGIAGSIHGPYRYRLAGGGAVKKKGPHLAHIRPPSALHPPGHSGLDWTDMFFLRELVSYTVPKPTGIPIRHILRPRTYPYHSP